MTRQRVREGTGADAGNHAATRRALLDAAADVFAEVGFRQATIRDICRQAGANVAAVNYHFGDKEALYAEVLTEQSRLAMSLHPSPPNDPTVPAEVRLEQFVRSFLQRVLSAELSARHGRMMAREMVDPTRALDRLVKESIRPNAMQLSAILRDLAGNQVPEEALRLAGMSVVGQILFYCHCQPVVKRLFPESPYDAGQLERLTRHITDFSLSALRGLATTGIPSKRRPQPGRRRTQT